MPPDPPSWLWAYAISTHYFSLAMETNQIFFRSRPWVNGNCRDGSLVHVDRPGFPSRHANGKSLKILRIEQRKLVVVFYIECVTLTAGLMSSSLFLTQFGSTLNAVGLYFKHKNFTSQIFCFATQMFEG